MACGFVIPSQIWRLIEKFVLWFVDLSFLARSGGSLSFFCIVNLAVDLACWHCIQSLTLFLIMNNKVGLMAHMIEFYVVLMVKLG